MSVKSLNDGTKSCSLCGTFMEISEYSKMEAEGDELWSTGYCSLKCKDTDEMVDAEDYYKDQALDR